MLSLTQATKTIAGLLSLSKAWCGAMGVDSHHRAFYSSHNAVFSPPRTITTKPHQPPIAVTVRPSVIYLMTKTRVVSSAGFDCVKWLWITGNKWKALYPGITNASFQVDQRHTWLWRMSMSCHWLCLQAEILVRGADSVKKSIENLNWHACYI